MPRLIRLLLLLLLVPTTAANAQLQAPNRLDVVERVADRCPGFILQNHAFTDAVATLLNAEDARWGRNGKRGNPGDPSDDALAFRNPGSPFGVSVVDIIGAAGSPGASPAWIDQTQATIDARTTGVWVAPSGRLPACLAGAAPPPPPPPPIVLTPTPPPTSPVLDQLLSELLALRAVVAELRQDLRAATSDMHAQFDRQTRRIFGVLVETDGSRPLGLAEETVNGIWERNSRDRLRTKASF